MSKLARALVLGATLAAMNLAAMTTVALAQANDQPTSNQDARRPPTEGQVGEAWRQPQVAAEQPTVADDTRSGRPTERPGRRALAPPVQRPGAISRAERAAQLAYPFARGAGRCPGARRRVGRAGRQAGRPQGSGRARGLTTVTPLDGAAAPTRQPHHLQRRHPQVGRCGCHAVTTSTRVAQGAGRLHSRCAGSCASSALNDPRRAASTEGRIWTKRFTPIPVGLTRSGTTSAKAG